MKKRIITGTLMMAVSILGLMGCQSIEESELQVEDVEMNIDPGYKMVTEAMDWGPAITKIILNMGVTVDEGMLDTETFLVSSKRQMKELELTTKRNVLDVYVTDEEGNRDAEGTCITIEMEVGPDMAEGSPFIYDFASGLNQYVDTAYLIQAAEGVVLKTKDGKQLTMEATDAGAGTSYYTETLMNLIETYVAGHDEIDTDRIYIGGCSNGGYMTLNMLIEYPGYFAAAYPVCEAYEANWLNDEKIGILKDVPIWLTAAKTDTTVSPMEHSGALYECLTKAGAQDIHFSFFENVVDTSGQYFKPDGRTPYEYNGHWSWIYVLNNECEDEIDGEKISVFEWLARQRKI